MNSYNFLNEQFAELLYKHATLEKNWILSTGIDNNKYEKANNKQNEKINALQIKNVNNAFFKNQFSYIFYRSITATPGVTYGVKFAADDAIYLTVNDVYLGAAAFITPITVYFTQPAGKTRARFRWVVVNTAGGTDFSTNPGAFAIGVYQGANFIGGTRGREPRGY